MVRGTRIGFASGTGASMNTAANVTEWLGWVLCAVTGSLDRPGGTIFNPGVLRPRERTPVPRGRRHRRRARTRPDIPPCYGGLPTAALADEILAGNIRALFVMGGNPALVFPESEKIAGRAARALELLIVCDIRHTETTALGDVVIPVTSQFERADCNTAMFHPVVLHAVLACARAAATGPQADVVGVRRAQPPPRRAPDGRSRPRRAASRPTSPTTTCSRSSPASPACLGSRCATPRTA